mmetsp:Transcript_27095/g.59196  ORF Transcript_27095/g.59196 Transcript_27095/m.59196 type:complete len:216 (+) Transcript_27095:441-1088(+)
MGMVPLYMRLDGAASAAASRPGTTMVLLHMSCLCNACQGTHNQSYGGHARLLSLYTWTDAPRCACQCGCSAGEMDALGGYPDCDIIQVICGVNATNHQESLLLADAARPRNTRACMRKPGLRHRSRLVTLPRSSPDDFYFQRLAINLQDVPLHSFSGVATIDEHRMATATGPGLVVTCAQSYADVRTALEGREFRRGPLHLLSVQHSCVTENPAV